MADASEVPSRLGLFGRAWRALMSPSARWSVLALLVTGIVIGAVGVGAGPPAEDECTTLTRLGIGAALAVEDGFAVRRIALWAARSRPLYGSGPAQAGS